MNACAVELGLSVPGHEQAGLPHDVAYKAPGLDMNQQECDSLVAFLEALPAPRQERPDSEGDVMIIDGGRQVFAEIGCAACHVPKLGDVDGIYSDLLLHDIGAALADIGSYGVFVPNSADEEIAQPPDRLAGATSDNVDELSRHDVEEDIHAEPRKVIGASRREWRTPPLWGVRDSAPYLHDGRAATLEAAIEDHGGAAALSAKRFSKLPAIKRLKLLSFLDSLAASAELAAAGELIFRPFK
jgi:CxxC motif-containing protein (DUF1111 family)